MIYEVRAETSGRVHGFGARTERSDAERLMTGSIGRVMRADGPLERFSTRVSAIWASKTWSQVDVEVLDSDVVVGFYDRSYAVLETFEPFQHDVRCFALTSPDNTAAPRHSPECAGDVASFPAGFVAYGPSAFLRDSATTDRILSALGIRDADVGCQFLSAAFAFVRGTGHILSFAPLLGCGQ